MKLRSLFLMLILAGLCLLQCATDSSAVTQTMEQLKAENEQLRRRLKDAGHLHDDADTSHHHAHAHGQEAQVVTDATHHHSETDKIMQKMPQGLLALSMVGFVVLDTFLMFVVNWKDAEVRNSVYKMLSTTVSIFCAVLINKTIFDFILLQVIPCPFPRGLGIETDPDTIKEGLQPCGRPPHAFAMYVGAAFFIGYAILLHIVSVYFRNDRGRSFLCSTITAHLIAFNGIEAFGIYQHVWGNDSVLHCCGVCAFAYIVFLMVRWASWAAPKVGREAILNAGTYGRPGLTAEEEENEWSEEAAEFEDEAVALCLGFLIAQTVAFYVTKKLPHLEESHSLHESKERDAFLLWECGGLVVLILMTVLRTTVLPHFKVKDTLVHRVAKTWQNTVGTFLAWTVFRHGSWFWTYLFHDVLDILLHGDFEAVHLIAMVVNAGSWTAFSVLAVIILDLIADLSRGDGDAQEKKIQNPCLRAYRYIARVFDPKRGTSQENMQRWKKETRRTNSAIVVDNKNKHSPARMAEKPLRELILVLGFLVGIAWEKAFHSASVIGSEVFFELISEDAVSDLILSHELVGPSVAWCAEHPMITRVIFSGSVVLAVGIAWAKYLAPFAQMSCDDHYSLLMGEQLRIDAVRSGQKVQDDDIEYFERRAERHSNNPSSPRT